MAAPQINIASATGTVSSGLANPACRAMIDGQLRVSDVNEEDVLAAFARVRREDFVPASVRQFAYMDRAIALGDGRYLAPPLVHGRMLCEARPHAQDKVLIIDGGSNYLPALLHAMGVEADVITAAEAPSAQPARGKYNLLLIDGAIEILPQNLADSLADGARIVTGLISDGVSRLGAGRKIAGEVSLMPFAEVTVPALPEFARSKGWSF